MGIDYSTKMGVLWEKTKDGKKYFTGNITVDGVKQDVVIFSNNKRPGKQDPDWQIFPSQPKQTTTDKDIENIPF